MIELRHLRTLVALRDAGSLVNAAESLFVTQSALSHQLKDLETGLDCRLFVRKTKPPRFTAAGRRLLDLADEILPMVRNAERDIARSTNSETGRLWISVECHSCLQWLDLSLNKYRLDWPQVEMDLFDDLNFSSVPGLLDGDFDLVITENPVELPGIFYVPLFAYEAMLVVDNKNRLSSRDMILPDDLETEQLIIYPVERDSSNIFERFLGPFGIKPTVIRTAEHIPMIIQLVASSRGVAFMPSWAVTQYLEQDIVVAKKLGESGLWCSFYAAIRENQKGEVFIRDFISTTIETCFSTLMDIKVAVEYLE